MDAQTAHIRNLHVLAYAAGFTLWVYKNPTQTLADIEAPGFFNSIPGYFVAGDQIHVAARDAGTILSVVSSSDAGGVVVRRLVFA